MPTTSRFFVRPTLLAATILIHASFAAPLHAIEQPPQSAAPSQTEPAPTTAPATAPATPAKPAVPAKREPAAPDVALAPLAFLAGHWTTTLPNGMVSEEMWMPVRGKSMLGSFRQTRPDGNPAFFEFTQVVATKDAVILRQVHLHGQFDIDERRKEPMFLKLAKVEGDSATFVPIADGEFGEGSKSHAGDLASVMYALRNAADGTDALTLRIESRPVKDPKDPEAEPKPQVIEISMRRAE
ncbi:MAG: DUF6265 family protein [bacterium]